MDGMARSPERRSIEALTGLRFFAALIVVVSHFPQIIPIERFQVPLERQGAAGVTIFFVLSGFVLAYNYADTFRTSTAGTLAFMRARIARIWPSGSSRAPILKAAYSSGSCSRTHCRF